MVEVGGYVDEPAVGRYRRVPWGHRGQRGGERGDRTSGVPPGDRDIAVHPLVGQARDGGERLGLAEHQISERQRIDPHVQQRPAPEARIEHPVRWWSIHDEAQIGVHLQGGAEPTGAKPVAHGQDHRMTGHPHRLHQEQSTLAGELDHLFGVGGVKGECLLAQHVLAGVEGQPRVLEVQRVRRGDVDDIDVRVVDQFGVRRVRARLRTAVRRGEGTRTVEAARTHGRDARSRRRLEVLGETTSDLAGGQNAPAGLGGRALSDEGHGFDSSRADGSPISADGRPVRMTPM